jgi:hypothetical protein
VPLAAFESKGESVADVVKDVGDMSTTPLLAGYAVVAAAAMAPGVQASDSDEGEELVSPFVNLADFAEYLECGADVDVDGIQLADFAEFL